MNSDLSCHELSKPWWEGQGSDDQRYHCREDQTAGRQSRNKLFIVRQTLSILPYNQNSEQKQPQHKEHGQKQDEKMNILAHIVNVSAVNGNNRNSEHQAC